jgi:predicted nucleotidyltransferase
MSTDSIARGLFDSVPADTLGFGLGLSFDPKRVQSFLGLSKEDISSLSGVAVASVRFDKAIPEAVRDHLQELGLLINRVALVFGGSTDKTLVWFRTLNHSLKDRSPLQMIQQGHWPELRSLVLKAMEAPRAIGGELDHQTLQAVKLFKERIQGSSLGSEIILYGSRARGQFRPDSDADVAVLVNDDARPLTATQIQLSDLAYDVMLDTGVSISPLPIRHQEWMHPERHANPVLLANIAREGIRI